jgi:lysophospholipase L1-like esterase
MLTFIRHISASLFLLIAFGVGKMHAQPVYDFPYVLPQYDFINYNLNKLSFPADSAYMKGFYEKMDKLIFDGVGKINIIHIGGSHVQADIVSGRLRERLATFFPGNKGSRGLIFPYRVAGTNNPGNYFVTYTGKWESCKNVSYKATCELGLTGMSITTRDTTSSISVSLKKENYPAYDFNRIRIFHRADTNQFKVKLGLLDSTKYSIQYDYVKGITDIYLKDHASEIQIQFIKNLPNQWFYTLYGIQLENDDAGVTYHSIGVNGAGTYSYLKCTLFEQHMAELKPDLVILGVGINDAAGSGFDAGTFELNYQKIIEKIHRASPNAAIIFITNNDSYRRVRRRYYVNYNATAVREKMFSLAAKYNLGVWDFFSIMGGLGSMATWQKNDLSKSDRVHFTTAGYKLMGDLMFNAILKSYENHINNKYH